MENNYSKGHYQINIGYKSDVGRVRTKNEDFLESFECGFGNVFIVCDGMGGHTGGEVASKLAVSTIKDFILNYSGEIKDVSKLISEALNAANFALHNKTKENPGLSGMGTTCVILIINSSGAYFGNIGDSRLYLIRGDKIHQLTRDQSFVRELVDQGLISCEDAENHPRKNEILQALGVTLKLKPQLNPEGLKVFKDDKFLLCSDGLSGMVKDNDILGIVNLFSVTDACDKLVDFANMNGGTDNITVLLGQVLDGDAIPDDLKNFPPLNIDIKEPEKTEKPDNNSLNEASRKIPASNDKDSRTGNSRIIFLAIVGIILVILALILFKKI